MSSGCGWAECSGGVVDRRSTRLAGYDYRENGAYFVTIVTGGRECLFQDPGYREIAEQVWRHLVRRSNHGRTDEFVVMPNHIHAIIWISNRLPVGAQHTSKSECDPGDEQQSGSGMSLENRRAAPLRGTDRGMPVVTPGSLGAIVRGYKSAVARRINEMRGTPGARVWQSRYHERIIRAERHLNAVRAYILDNPRRWAEDRLNPANAIAAPHPTASLPPGDALRSRRGTPDLRAIMIRQEQMAIKKPATKARSGRRPAPSKADERTKAVQQATDIVVDLFGRASSPRR